MTRADAPGARRTLEHDADTAAENPAADGAGPARAWRLLRAGAASASVRARQALLAAATAAIDKGIASLQRLRLRAGGAQQPDEDRDDANARVRAGRARERPGRPEARARPKGEPDAAEAAAPQPRRRLRSLLVYLSVMLAGAMGGMALAYDLLAQLLDQRSAEVDRQEIKLSKLSKSMAELKGKLGVQEAKRTEAQTRLAAAVAQDEKNRGELQRLRAEADARLADAPAGRARDPQRQDDGGGRNAARNAQTGWGGAGDCTLGSGNIRSVLGACLAEMNRR